MITHKFKLLKMFFTLSILCTSHAATPKDFFEMPQDVAQTTSSVDTILDPTVMKTTILNAVQSARSQIIICSPFLSNNSMHTSGLDQLLATKIKEGVRVGIATCSNLTSTKQYEVKAIELLQKMGASVKFYEHIHAKFILIDDVQSLIGSFNFLSGSFDQKYRFYQLNLLESVKGNINKEVIRHAMAILKNESAPSAIPNNLFSVYSQSREMGALYAKLIKDAKQSLLICSPNLSYNFLRVSGFLDSIKNKILQGVAVTIFTDSEMDNAKPDAMQARLQLGILGARLILKKGIHLKFIIQDDSVVYTGSDNMLAGATQAGGEGFWRELGMLINFKGIESIEIKNALDRIPTVMDTYESQLETPKAPRTPEMHSLFPATPFLLPQQIEPLPAARFAPQKQKDELFFSAPVAKKTLVNLNQLTLVPSEDSLEVFKLAEQRKRAREDVVSLSSLSSSESSYDSDASSTSTLKTVVTSKPRKHARTEVISSASSDDSDASSDSVNKSSTTNDSDSSISSSSLSSSDSEVVLTQRHHKKRFNEKQKIKDLRDEILLRMSLLSKNDQAFRKHKAADRDYQSSYKDYKKHR